MAAGRNYSAIASCRPHDFANIEITSGIDADVMRSEEIARRTRIALTGPTSQEPTLKIENAKPRARQIGEPGCVSVRSSLPGEQSGLTAKFDDERAVVAVDGDLRRPDHVRPFGQEFPRGSEDLDAGVLPVRHVDSA